VESTNVPQQPMERAVCRAAMDVLRDERDCWRALAESRGEDNAVLTVMLEQSLTIIHDRERAEARRTERVVRLLDGLPHVRESVTAGFLEDCQRLRAELLEHYPDFGECSLEDSLV
jgi:hypothetical protein